MSTLSGRRILLVIADGSLGGGTTVVDALARQLLEAGCDVHLLTDAGSHLAASFGSTKITVHELPFFGRRFDPSLTAAVAKLHAVNVPDILHVHGSRALFSCRKILKRQPTIYTVHGYHLLHQSIAKRVVATIVERRQTRLISKILFVSENDRTQGEHHRLFARNIPTAVIHNGIDTEGLELTPMQPLAAGVPLAVVFLSRLSYPKDPMLALDVAEALGPAFEMEMIGGGELEAEVRQQVLDRKLISVRVSGAVPRESALEKLRHADVLLLTSRWEGLPLAPLEAMAVGAAVVAPDIPAMREILGALDAGILVSGREPERFAAAVRSLVDDETRSRTRSEARALIEERFSWRTTWERHQDAYTALLAGR